MKKYIVVALTLVLLLIQGAVVKEAVGKLPSSFFFDKTTEMTAEQWLSWQGEETGLYAAPCVRRQTSIEKNPVQTVYTTELCQQLAGVPMKYGSLPWEKGQIAISDRLATQLFFTDDILGAELAIGEETYTICGIYLLDKSLIGRMSQSVYEEAFLYLGDFEQQDMKLSEFFVGVRKGEYVSSLMGGIESKLGPVLEYKELRSLLERKELLEQSCSLARLVVAVTLLVWSCLRLAPAALAILLRQEDDPRPTPAQWLNLAGLVLCVAGSVVLLRWCAFNLLLPMDWLEFKGNIVEYLWQWMKIRNGWKDYTIFRYTETAGSIAAALGIGAAALGIYGAIADIWQAKKRNRQK